ncbi:MAG: hypothetical protein IJE92_05560 [Clostridia bacterium]|nr:hypothetical protein [Clostridia bacterium]
MYYTDEKKRELINALAIAQAKGDEEAAQDLAIELYEAYGWCGTPYYCDR